MTIERAIGLLMGRDGVDAAAAFNELRRTARNSRRRVSAVAEEVLAGHGDEVRLQPDLDGLGRILDGDGPRGSTGSASSTSAYRPRRSPTRGSTSAKASSRPSTNARIGNDGDQRASALSGRTSWTRSLSQTGVPARCAQIATASSVHGRNATSSSGTLTRTPGRRMPPSW